MYGCSIFILCRDCKQENDSENIVKCVYSDIFIYSKASSINLYIFSWPCKKPIDQNTALFCSLNKLLISKTRLRTKFCIWFAIKFIHGYFYLTWVTMVSQQLFRNVWLWRKLFSNDRVITSQWTTTTIKVLNDWWSGFNDWLIDWFLLFVPFENILLR